MKPPEQVLLDLSALVDQYDGELQFPVRFRVPSWQTALKDCPSPALRRLTDPRYTEPVTSDRPERADDRTVDRPALRSMCEAMDLTKQTDVLSAFVLVMAWGSGMSGSRGLRNTARALGDPAAAHRVLTASAQMLRGARTPADGGGERAYAQFRLPGVGQPFFSKWFAFAGFSASRAWQPLILDRRVYATLNNTLSIDTGQLAQSRRRATRYIAYIETMHEWAATMADNGQAIDAERLEWVLFAHNGSPLPATRG